MDSVHLRIRCGLCDLADLLADYVLSCGFEVAAIIHRCRMRMWLDCDEDSEAFNQVGLRNGTVLYLRELASWAAQGDCAPRLLWILQRWARYGWRLQSTACSVAWAIRKSCSSTRSVERTAEHSAANGSSLYGMNSSGQRPRTNCQLDVGRHCDTVIRIEYGLIDCRLAPNIGLE